MSSLISEEEAAALIGRSRRYVYELRKKGQLQYIPGAGRAKVMIDRASLEMWIKENTCQEKNYPQESSSRTATTTSRLAKMAEAKEQAYGQLIFYKRKAVSRAG